jgi:hypothetical protein
MVKYRAAVVNKSAESSYQIVGNKGRWESGSLYGVLNHAVLRGRGTAGYYQKE